MGLEEKMDMVISMVASMNEQMTEKFGQIDERFDQIDEKFAQIDERFDQIDEKFAQIDERFDQMDKKFAQTDDRFDRLEDKLEALREENAKEHDILRGQIGAVAEALNISNAMHDARYEEMKQNDEELKQKYEALQRVQDQHSIDIMALRAAM